MKRSLYFQLTVWVALGACSIGKPMWAQAGPGHRLGQTNYYLTEFEKEVARERGGEKMVWRNKKEALDRVKALKLEFPDDPEVEKLFQRARVALKKSMGQISEVNPAWTQYLRNEADLRKLVWAEGEKAWRDLLARAGTNVLNKVFPAPDMDQVLLDELKGTTVVLEGVRYPADQFYGGSGEYIAYGKASAGYYFISLRGRAWLGPYEAVKRFRREVDTDLQDVSEWSVLGQIVGITLENPHGLKDPSGRLEYGWVVEPIALKVPEHVVAFRDAQAIASGRYAGEELVKRVKEGWFTVKSVPPNATPERVMEIFITAIKEKNYPLFLDCIDPRRRTGFNAPQVDAATGEIVRTTQAAEAFKYHWDLHQERFHGEYVHATVGKAKIVTAKGFNRNDELNDFFLDEADKAKIAKASGDLVETAIVETMAIDANGKQLGSPHPHKLVRRNGGRWYVEDYAPRF